MNKSHAALSSVPSGREDRLIIKSSQSNAMGTTLKTHLDQEGKKAGRLAWGELAVTAPVGLDFQMMARQGVLGEGLVLRGPQGMRSHRAPENISPFVL